MKKTILVVALIATAGLMSFTTINSNENTTKSEVASGFVDVKIKNDTGEEHIVITSFGGSYYSS